MRQFRVWMNVDKEMERVGKIVFPDSDHTWFSTLLEAKMYAVKLRLQGWTVEEIQEKRIHGPHKCAWKPGQPEKKRKKKCVVKAG